MLACLSLTDIVDFDIFSTSPVEGLHCDLYSSHAQFVEVKGPTDRLSSKQVLWLNRLVQWGCEAEVCKVKGEWDVKLRGAR